MKKDSSETGRSMVEMLGVIAIIGVISVGGITSMSYIDSYFRTSSTLLEVDQMAQDINDMCSWSSSYSNCLKNNPVDTLIEEGVLASNKNRWGGAIEVKPGEELGNGYDFEIHYHGVPESVCEQMAEEGSAETADGRKHLVDVFCVEGVVKFCSPRLN